MAYAIRIHLDRYWPLPNWARARADGISAEHALAISAVRRCLRATVYEPFQEQGLRALYEALSLHVYPARTYAEFGQRLHALARALQGGPLASDVLARARANAHLIRRALGGASYRLGNKTHQYNPHTLAVLTLSPERFLATVSEHAAKTSTDHLWASIDADQLASQPIAKRAQASRHGPRWRPDDSPVSDQWLRDSLGLRAVRFGASVPHKERALLRSALFDAGHDLAHVLGFAPAALGLGRRLTLAIGVRVAHSQAPGHYLPGQHVINATRFGGLGTLAHEYAHALDDYLGERLGGPGTLLSKAAYRRARPRTENLPLVAMARLMDELCQDRSLPEADQASRFLRDAALHDARHGRAGRRSYMSTPQELFARALELLVESLLSEAGWRSPLLTRDLSRKTHNANPLAYPGEPERSRVTDAVSRALPTLLVGAGLTPGAQADAALATPPVVADSPEPEHPPRQLGLRL